MHQDASANRISTTIIPFPLRARVADVRRAAALLSIKRLTEEAAINRWVRITDRLARDLEVCGFEPVVIAMELCDFEDAVNDEIARRTGVATRH